MPRKPDSSYQLNAALGFLSLLLIVLLAGLFSRMVYPRITGDRPDQDAFLISNVIQIEILNGYGQPGLASEFTGHLRDMGFDVVSTGNFRHFDVHETFVIDRRGNLENARRIAEALGVPEEQIIRETSDDYYLDVTVVLGADHHELNR